MQGLSDDDCRVDALFKKGEHEMNKQKSKSVTEQIEEVKEQICEDAISRQAVIDAIYDMEILKYRIDLENVIKALPSVTPKQVPKTGHWRHYEGMLICSECGTEFYDDIMEYCGDDVPKCCPDCGIRMVEPQESEVKHG